MNRKTIKIINSDRIINNLRMQSQDLINNSESLSDEQFKLEAKRIEDQMDQRIAELLAAKDE